MAVAEFDFIKPKLIEGAQPLRPIPRVGKQYAANIPKDCADFSQDALLCRSYRNVN
jgi:hypothetical protein